MLSRRIVPKITRSVQNLTRAASTAVKNVDSSSSVPENKAAESTPAPAVWQAPNFPSTWSTSQLPRPQAASSPRFEQTNMDLQPQPLSAMELIADEPIRLVQGRRAVCDGGGGPLGHPKIYINLDQPGPRACGYCGIRFEQDPHHHHHH